MGLRWVAHKDGAVIQKDGVGERERAGGVVVIDIGDGRLDVAGDAVLIETVIGAVTAEADPWRVGKTILKGVIGEAAPEGHKGGTIGKKAVPSAFPGRTILDEDVIGPG